MDNGHLRLIEGRASREEGAMPAMESGRGAPSKIVYGKKTCPRCGEVLFADMQVCYGCLYDFSKSDHGPSERAAPPLDEPDDLGAGGGAAVAAAVELAARYKASKHLSAPFYDFEADEVTTVLDEGADASPKKAARRGVYVKARDADVFVPLGPLGLCVGRGAGNDVVVHDKAVSRRHLRLREAAGGVEVIDLGSTNPARYEGKPLEGAVVVPWGGSVRLGRATLLMGET